MLFIIAAPSILRYCHNVRDWCRVGPNSHTQIPAVWSRSTQEPFNRTKKTQSREAIGTGEDRNTEQSQEFAENGAGKKKHPVSSSSAGRNILSVREVRGEGPEWSKLTGRWEQITIVTTWYIISPVLFDFPYLCVLLIWWSWYLVSMLLPAVADYRIPNTCVKAYKYGEAFGLTFSRFLPACRDSALFGFVLSLAKDRFVLFIFVFCTEHAHASKPMLHCIHTDFTDGPYPPCFFSLFIE